MSGFGGVGGGPAPGPGRSIRIGIAVVATVVAVVVLVWARDGGDSVDVPQPDAPAADQAPSTTGVDEAPTTTTFLVDLDPSWSPKESSLFSESEEAKLRRDTRPDVATTTSTSLDDGGGGSSGSG